MTCVSEGAIDVYVEPFVQARRLVVVGATPVAESLARLARSMNYDVVRVVDGREQRDIEQEAATLGVTVVTLDALEAILREGGAGGADLAAVVVSQGHYDEEALESILRCGVPYVGLVASRTRGAAVRAMLEERGVPGVATIRNPAGLDLGARTPPEVALSILAEIVQARPSGVRVAATTPAAASPVAAPRASATAVDPVCGMSVTVASARQTAEVDGVVVLLLLRELPREVPQRPPGVPGPSMTDAAAIHDRFRERGFIVDEAFATALQIMLALEKPLLIEGPAGVGKTESAKVLAEVLGTELIRLQCYEGLDAMAALYEWNYPRQMLHARLSEAEGSSLDEREAYMFSERFLLKRPLLDAITRERSPVLLIDEVDRADEAFEAFLLEVLAEWQVTIPELGTIRARHKPHVILTSNRTRELSDALRRRCLFLWLPYPSLAQEIEILHARVPGLSDRLAQQIARLMQALRGLAPAEGARRGGEPRLGDGADEPAPRAPRRAHAGADAGMRAEGARGSRRHARASRGARSHSGRRAREPRIRRVQPRHRLRVRFRVGAAPLMYPFASLPENLAAFCEALRRQHGFRIGPGELHDAARALDVVDLANERAVRHALRPILGGTLDDVTVFDAAFTRFFFPGPAGVRAGSDALHAAGARDRMPTAATRTPSTRVMLRHRRPTRTKRPGWAAVR